MGWEIRGGGRYYVRKVWQGGTARSQYVGSGHPAELAAQIDAAARQERAGARQAWQLERAAIDALDQQLAEALGLVGDVTTVAYLLSGYRQHKRQWRKQRDYDNG